MCLLYDLQLWIWCLTEFYKYLKHVYFFFQLRNSLQHRQLASMDVFLEGARQQLGMLLNNASTHVPFEIVNTKSASQNNTDKAQNQNDSRPTESESRLFECDTLNSEGECSTQKSKDKESSNNSKTEDLPSKVTKDLEKESWWHPSFPGNYCICTHCFHQDTFTYREIWPNIDRRVTMSFSCQ